ncbi:MAG: oligosaccharide flippase family protein [Anaerolineae bacterium]|nr:oligosaccharide flippase family protein [Anaerolineae bacterium]
MRSLWLRYRHDAIAALALLALPLALFWQTTIGDRTLLPADNLYQWEPWSSFREQVGVGVPHNELLSDLLIENYAWKRFVLASFRQPGGLTNRLPLWNPYLWAGAPFLADAQHSALYPFSLLFYVLPLTEAYGWFTVLQFWMAGLSMYVLARTLGANRFGATLSGIVYPLSSVYVVSTVFTMIIAAMVWLPLLLAAIEQVVRAQMRGGSGVTTIYVIGGALALGCQMLAGHPEITYYTGLVMGLYALARLAYAVIAAHGHAQAWTRALRTGAWLLALVVLGGCIGAAQFVPLYEFVSDNFRAGSESYETIISWAFPARRAIALLVPNFFGNPAHHAWFDILRWEWVPVGRNILGQATDPPHTIYWGIKNAVEGGSYVGVLPLLLALVGAIAPLRRRSPDAGHSGAPYAGFAAAFFGLLALFALSLVFGLPTYRIVFALPGINQLHSPFRWLFPYTLSVAALAGLGATALTGRRLDAAPRKLVRLLGWAALGGGLAGIIALLIALPLTGQLAPFAERVMRSLAKADTAFASGRMFLMYEWPQLALFATLLAASGALLLTSGRPLRLPRRLGGYSLWRPLAAIAVGVDLFLIGYGFNPAAKPEWLAFTPPSIAYLKEQQALDPHFRITTYIADDEKPLNANTPWLYDIQDVRGYGSAIAKQYVDYVSLVWEQFELLYNRVSPIPTSQPQALDSPLLDLLGVRYVVTTHEIASPRYELVYDAEVRIYRNSGAMPRAFTLPATSAVYTGDLAEAMQRYDPRHHAILDGEAPPGTPDPVTGSPQRATIAQYAHNEVYVDVNVSEPSWLILADSYYPGWRAYARPQGGSESDERELTIVRHAGNFRAVLLEPGQHTVRFKYTPTSVKVGFFMCFLGATVLLLMLVVWLWRRYVGGAQGGSDAQRVAKNSVAPIVLQLFNKAIDTAFAMLALRILAPARHGQYYFVINIVMYTDVFINFGLNIWLQREIAKAREAGNRYLSNAVIVRLGLCLVAGPALVLFVVLWPLFARLFVLLGWSADVQTLGANQVWALALFAIGLIPTNVAAALTALFQAHERMEIPAAITVISTLIKAILGTAALLAGWGIVGLGGASILTNLATLAILLVLTARLFWVPRLAFDWRLQREMLRQSWPLMVNNLLSMAFFKADVILLKAIEGDLVLGLYSSVAYKMIDAINIVPTAFTVALFPLMSRYAATSRETMHRTYSIAVRLLVVVALPLAITFTTLAYPLATLIGGSGYMPDSAIALQIMIWSIPLGFVNSVTHYVLIALGRQRALTITFLIGLSCSVIANAICIPLWGYRASAAIHILAELVLLAAFYVLMRGDLPPVRWHALLWRPALAGAMMGLAAWALYGVHVLLATVAAYVAYAGTLWAVGIAREPDIEIIRDLLPRLGRAKPPVPSAEP